MGLTTDDILGRGQDPRQGGSGTWAQPQAAMGEGNDGGAGGEGAPDTATDEGLTGVESVGYDDVTTQGARAVQTGQGAQGAQGEQRGDGGSQGESRLTYAEMYRMMNPYKPPTAEELERERARQSREARFAALGDGLSALSNLYFTTQYAPNAYDGTKSMSGRSRARYDRLIKERTENQRQWMDGYMRALALDDQRGDRERDWRHRLDREVVEDKRYEDNLKHRNEREGVEDDRWQRQFEESERRFEESVRQFNETNEINRRRLGMEASRLSREIENDGSVSFALGEGKGTVRLPANAINDANISYVYNLLPDEVRRNVHGEPIKTKRAIMNDHGYPTGQYEEVITYKPPTREAMLIAIGANVGNNDAVAAALREISGAPVGTPAQTPTKRPNPMGETGRDGRRPNPMK